MSQDDSESASSWMYPLLARGHGFMPGEWTNTSCCDTEMRVSGSIDLVLTICSSIGGGSAPNNAMHAQANTPFRDSHSACILSLSYASHIDHGGRPGNSLRQATAPSGSHPMVHISELDRVCMFWCSRQMVRLYPGSCGALQLSVDPSAAGGG